MGKYARILWYPIGKIFSQQIKKPTNGIPLKENLIYIYIYIDMSFSWYLAPNVLVPHLNWCNARSNAYVMEGPAHGSMSQSLEWSPSSSVRTTTSPWNFFQSRCIASRPRLLHDGCRIVWSTKYMTSCECTWLYYQHLWALCAMLHGLGVLDQSTNSCTMAPQF